MRLAIEDAIAAGEVRPLDAETVARLFYLMVMNEVGRARSGDPAPASPEALVGIRFDGIAMR